MHNFASPEVLLATMLVPKKIGGTIPARYISGRKMDGRQSCLHWSAPEQNHHRSCLPATQTAAAARRQPPRSLPPATGCSLDSLIFPPPPRRGRPAVVSQIGERTDEGPTRARSLTLSDEGTNVLDGAPEECTICERRRREPSRALKAGSWRRRRRTNDDVTAWPASLPDDGSREIERWIDNQAWGGAGHV